MREHRADLPNGVLTVTEEENLFPLESICEFGARDNKKRGFLFVSKVLGKHIPSRLESMDYPHKYLANTIKHDPTGPVVFIGMAETAVGLGYGVFEAWQDQNKEDAVFIHTTRYKTGLGKALPFEEGHSHAPNQFIHTPATDVELLMHQAKTVVLIDDEASTGKTFANLWQVVRNWLLPNVTTVNIATLTNFMSEEDQENLVGKINKKTYFTQLVRGSWSFQWNQENTVAEQKSGPEIQPVTTKEVHVPGHLGRHGIAGRLKVPAFVMNEIESIILADLPANLRKIVRIVGVGEFMHPSIAVARVLKEKGYKVILQSSTRSPIKLFGPINEVKTLKDPYRQNDAHFIYNAEPDQSVTTLLLHEVPINEAIKEMAEAIGAHPIYWGSGV